MIRTVFGNISRPDGTPWVGGKVTFTLSPGSYTAAEQYPPAIVETRTDAAGDFTADLWANEEGEAASVYTASLPNGEKFTFTLPAGDGSDISIYTLRVAGEINRNWTEDQITAFIESNPALVGPQGPAGDTGLIMSGFVGVTALTRAEYDALAAPLADRLYVVLEAGVQRGITAIVSLTQAEYDALPAPDDTTLYLTPS